MYLSKMFFGLPIKGELAECLHAIDPKVKALFIRDDDSYLQMVTLDHQNYLGKKLSIATSLASLELLETHIYSILHKLAPAFPAEKNPLMLIPYQDVP